MPFIIFFLTSKIFEILPFQRERFLKFYHLPITIYHFNYHLPLPHTKKNFHKKISKFSLLFLATNKMSFIIFPNIENIKKLIRCRLSFLLNIENF